MNKISSKSKKKCWNWSVISSVVSSCAAIVAIFIGVIQFNKSIEKTDQQIELIEKEAQLRIEENRPLISINKNKVYDFKSIKQYQLVIGNIGNRPAFDIEIKSSVVSLDKNLSNPVIKEDSIYTYTNSINKEQEVRFVGNLELDNNYIYFIKTQVSYVDEVFSKQNPYTQSFYFKWSNIQDMDYLTDILYGAGKNEKKMIDKILSSM